MNYTDLFEILTRVSFALICGALIGLERLISHKTAGMRTYAIASGGSALFIILSQLYAVANNNHPQFVLGQIVVGIGFLAAGSIIMSKDKVVGLTTASGIWFMSAIGATFGYGYYLLGFGMTFVLLFSLSVLLKLEHYLVNNFIEKGDSEYVKKSEISRENLDW
jgi:putative Mg2+ transporter-C (MgtC) family protein